MPWGLPPPTIYIEKSFVTGTRGIAAGIPPNRSRAARDQFGSPTNERFCPERPPFRAVGHCQSGRYV